jgi:hypothetical protein
VQTELRLNTEKKVEICSSNKKGNKVGGGSERYHFYSGRRSFVGCEGSQAVYYLSSRHVRLEVSEKKVRR